jgi:hypothetical protein
VLPADQEKADDQPAVGEDGKDPRDDDLRWLLLERGGKKRFDDVLDGDIRRCGVRVGCRLLFATGRLRGIPRGTVVHGQADRFRQQEAEDSDRKAEQSGCVQVRFEQRPARESQIKEAAQEPRGRADEQPDEAGPRRIGLVAGDRHHAGNQDEEEQEIEIPDAPDAAELEEERHAAQEREKEPDLRVETKIGNEYAFHGNLISPIQMVWVRPRAGTVR